MELLVVMEPISTRRALPTKPPTLSTVQRRDLVTVRTKRTLIVAATVMETILREPKALGMGPSRMEVVVVVKRAISTHRGLVTKPPTRSMVRPRILVDAVMMEVLRSTRAPRPLATRLRSRTRMAQRAGLATKVPALSTVQRQDLDMAHPSHTEMPVKMATSTRRVLASKAPNLSMGHGQDLAQRHTEVAEMEIPARLRNINAPDVGRCFQVWTNVIIVAL